jgi:UDP-N-acetylglucosamine--N-acetylmuramyl-(pentapeptide) pyrophosphoryl-undecaprenol N-acetylglucosamine transferase
MKSKVIFIAGGGTGGHIYPGVAIARAILQKDPDMKIRFVGTSTGLESKIVPREGFELDLIQGGKLNFTGGNFEKIKTLCKIPVGLIQALSLILKHRPRFVLGVGGYASGPFVLVAAPLAFTIC